MENSPSQSEVLLGGPALLQTQLARSYMNWIGRKLLRLVHMIHGMGAFALITFGVTVTKFNRASRVVHPIVREQIYRAGVRLLPMVSFLAFALGLVVIGQTVALLNRYG